MNELERSPAEERLLDAALAEVFGRPAVAVRTRRARWLAAALVLLGVAAVLGALLGRAASRTDTPVQEPDGAPLVPQYRARNVDELMQLPADAQDVRAVLLPRDLPALARFPGLRRLKIFGARRQDGPGGDWNEAVGALEDIGRLGSLETLEVPVARTADLEALRRLPRLRALALGNKVCTKELADQLVSLSQIRELELKSCEVTAAFVQSLDRCSLRRLSLLACRGLDAGAQRAIAGLRSLEAVSLKRLLIGKPAPEFDRDAFAAICGLPKLRELSLVFTQGTDLDAFFALLPEHLESLEIGDELSVATIRSLRRLGNLRSLSLWHGKNDPQAIVDLLGTLRLHHFGGDPSPSIVAALAEQQDLRGLEFGIASNAAPVPEEVLAKLRRCRALRSVRLTGVDVDCTEWRKVLGDRVVVVDVNVGPMFR